MKTQLAAFILFAFLVVGCGSTQKGKQKAQENTNKEMTITEKYWKLKTLQGQAIIMAENQEQEIHIILKTEENRFTGFSGCNTFNGIYALEDGNRIRFSKLASTMKACPDLDVDEAAFLKVFDLADNYTISNDILSLNVGRRAPLAVFEAVYFD
jgi:heat shock protein HslJ